MSNHTKLGNQPELKHCYQCHCDYYGIAHGCTGASLMRLNCHKCNTQPGINAPTRVTPNYCPNCGHKL